MNNADFRRFINDTPSQSNSQSPPNHRQDASKSYLGSRSRANVPMTPRSVKATGPTVDFARQLAEQDTSSQTPPKKFKTSAAPRGVKLGKGYVDRARERLQDGLPDGQDDKASRIQALEEQLKLGQIDQQTFEQLRDSITGGDLSATHLVKGLDRRLLERVRKGEDVSKSSNEKPPDQPNGQMERSPDANADEELGKLEAQELAPVQHERAEKKGEMAPPPAPKQVAGAKRSRDQILAELKASRKAAQQATAAAQSQLGSKFRKFAATASTEPRIERDEKGREVLITVDEHGRVKRKIRKTVDQDSKARLPSKNSLPMPDSAAKPLGMAVPEGKPRTTEASASDSDEDIFQGVDDSYDPLEALRPSKEYHEEDDASSSSSDSELSDEGEAKPPTSEQRVSLDKQELVGKHNYFNDAPASRTESQPSGQTLQDPTILAALHRAAELNPQSTPTEDDSVDSSAQDSNPSTAASRLQARMRDRDMDDLDMGFGSSRFDDDEEEEGGSRLKLSEWKGLGGGNDDDDEDDKGDRRARGGTSQRKRGKKKKKGDKDSAKDVLGVLAGRK